VTLSSVLLTKATLRTATPPNVTDGVSTKSAPVIVIEVPPEISPLGGMIEIIVGALVSSPSFESIHPGFTAVLQG